jgi:hypothetical protein
MPYLTSAVCPELKPRMRWTVPFFLLSSAGSLGPSHILLREAIAEEGETKG